MSTNLREKLSKLPMTWTQIEAVLQALSETGHLLCAEDVEKIAHEAVDKRRIEPRLVLCELALMGSDGRMPYDVMAWFKGDRQRIAALEKLLKVERPLESNRTSAGHAAQGDPASGVHAALQETARGPDILAAEAKPDSHSVGRSSGVGGEVLNSATASGAEGGGGVGAVPSPSPVCTQQDLDAHWRSMWAQSEERVRELAREELVQLADELKAEDEAYASNPLELPCFFCEKKTNAGEGYCHGCARIVCEACDEADLDEIVCRPNHDPHLHRAKKFQPATTEHGGVDVKPERRTVAPEMPVSNPAAPINQTDAASIRDMALEEAAAHIDFKDGYVYSADDQRGRHAKAIRSLKSQPAPTVVKSASEVVFNSNFPLRKNWCQSCTSTLPGYHMSTCPVHSAPTAAANPTPMPESRFPGHVRALQSEVEALKKERDELRAKLAEAEKKLADAEWRIANLAEHEKWSWERRVELETKLAEADKALDDIAEHVCAGADPGIDHRTCICEILQRTGRLVQIRNPATVFGGPPSERPSGTTPAPAQEPADRSLGSKG